MGRGSSFWAAHDPAEDFMQLRFISVMVEDQEKALQFYTSMLGFEKMADIPMRP